MSKALNDLKGKKAVAYFKEMKKKEPIQTELRALMMIDKWAGGSDFDDAYLWKKVKASNLKAIKKGDIQDLRARLKDLDFLHLEVRRSRFELSKEAYDYALSVIAAEKEKIELECEKAGFVLAEDEQAPRKKTGFLPDQEPYCCIITHEGTKQLTKIEYEELTKQRQLFDIIIDGIAKEVRGRDKKGRFKKNKLTAGEFKIIAPFIQTKKRLRPVDVKIGEWQNEEAASRVFRNARKKVDRKLRRYQWQCFRLHKEPDSKNNKFEFDPPKTLTYCLIIPAE